MSNDYTPPPPASGGGGALVYPSSPPKDPVLILLLNLFLAGVGYLVIGQKTKGIVVIVVAIAVALPSCGTWALPVAIAAAVDGYLQATQLKAGHAVGQWTFFNDHR